MISASDDHGPHEAELLGFFSFEVKSTSHLGQGIRCKWKHGFDVAVSVHSGCCLPLTHNQVTPLMTVEALF